MIPFRPPARVPAVLWVLTGAMLLVEALLAAADEGLIGQPDTRWTAFRTLGFFAISLQRALAGGGVDAQLLWSLVTHTFVHAGWMHVLLNAVALLAFGNVVCGQIGTARFLVFYVVTAAAGALALGLITAFAGPLVGVSGVVFGLLGILTAWESTLRRRRGESRGPVFARVGALVALNLLLFVFADAGLDAKLAWEAHLGGFVAGWLLSYVFPPLALRYSERPSVQG